MTEPIQVEIVSESPAAKDARIYLDGVDVSRHVRRFEIAGGVGAEIYCRLELVNLRMKGDVRALLVTHADDRVQKVQVPATMDEPTPDDVPF